MFLTILQVTALIMGLGMITYPLYEKWDSKYSKWGKIATKTREDIDRMSAQFLKDLEASKGISPEHEKMIEEAVEKALKPHNDEFFKLAKELRAVYAWNDFVFKKCKEYEKDPTPGTLQRIKNEIREAEEAKARVQS